jgi:Tol biopolymer transport system component
MIRTLVVIILIIGIAGCKKDKNNHEIEKAVAFAVQKSESASSLWYSAIDGSSFSEVLNDNIGTAIDNPAWSTDGRRIFFIKRSANKGENGIFSVRPNGAELTTVFKDNEDQLRKYYQICTDNKNENVVFSLEIPRSGRNVIELFTMCPCGDRVVRLTEFETSASTPISTEAYAGSFSAGDTALYFTQSDPQINGKKDIRIYRRNMQSKTQVLIKIIKAISAEASIPSVSPIGGKILLSIDGIINTMNSDGSELKPLGSLKGFHPLWDKNGRDFYFSSFGIDGMEQGIYQADINLTEVKRITRSGGIGQYGGFSINL